MKTSIFLSYPKPCHTIQEQFITKVTDYLITRSFLPRTLGVTDYDMDAPLTAIRRLMLESNGLITIAFRRTYIEKGATNFDTDIPERRPVPIENKWLTSPWSHIEPAMAFQLGLPILLFREKDVIDDGILERGVAGAYMPEFDLDDSLESYFSSIEWMGPMARWEGYVREVVNRKGIPPRLY